jgi:radical SAM protein with 4Fe4S-binding SPASM domain
VKTFERAREYYRYVRDNDAYRLATRPGVLLNYARFRREFAARPLVMRSTPPGIEIELTNRCNLACVQCLRSRGLRPYALGDITFEHFRRILAQFPNIYSLTLNGFGEPLLHRDFAEIVAHTRAERPWCKIVIYDNGMLLDEERVRAVINCGLTEINVSIDAATPDTYRRVRRGGTFEVVHDNLRRLVRRRREAGARFPRVGVNFVMLNENEGELVPFIDQAAEIGVDFVNCITLATYDWGFGNRRSPANYARELEQAAAHLAQLGLRCRSFPSRDIAWAAPDRAFDCSFFWGDNLRITYAGDVTLGCCTPFRETYTYGNVLETPFTEIWNNERFRDNRRKALEHVPPTTSCQSCAAFAACFFASAHLRP